MNRLLKICVLFACGMIFLSANIRAKAQYIPENTAVNDIYFFLSEMHSLKIINTTDAVKPFSRCLISRYLTEIEKNKSQLNKRQLFLLDFFAAEYAFDCYQNQGESEFQFLKRSRDSSLFIRK